MAVVPECDDMSSVVHYLVSPGVVPTWQGLGIRSAQWVSTGCQESTVGKYRVSGVHSG